MVRPNPEILTKPCVDGDMIRDYGLDGTTRYWPYDYVGGKFVARRSADKESVMWPSRRVVRGYVWFGKTSLLNIFRQHLVRHPVCKVDLQLYCMIQMSRTGI